MHVPKVYQETQIHISCILSRATYSYMLYPLVPIFILQLIACINSSWGFILNDSDYQMQSKCEFSQIIFRPHWQCGLKINWENAHWHTVHFCPQSMLQTESRNVPMEELLPLLSLILSSVLWGVTDALMKPTAPPSSSSSSIGSTLLSLISSPAYLTLLLVNQLGSILYYFSLSLGRLSVISPVVNTGKFIVTAATGRFLGEPKPSQRKIAGLVLLLLGVILQLTAWGRTILEDLQWQWMKRI